MKHIKWKVKKWNGKDAAISFTFDDGDISQATDVLNLLNERGIKGTFFLIGNQIQYLDEWKEALRKGHEIGNHSLSHLTPDKWIDASEISEICGAQVKLSEAFNTDVLSFAYPYTFVTDDMVEILEKTHLSARAGISETTYMKVTDDPMWYKLPSQIAFSYLRFQDYKKWMDETFKNEAWTILQFHALEGTDNGYQPIRKDLFARILDYANQENVWVAPFGKISAYWRAQKEIEKANVKESENEIIIDWEVPAVLPGNTYVLMELEAIFNEKFVVKQGDSIILPNHENSYKILFSEGKLTIQCGGNENGK